VSQIKGTLKVAYLLDMFPTLSETFILNEIIELKRQGLDIAAFSVSKPNEGVIHKEAERLARETYYFDDFRNLSNFNKACIYLYVHSYFIITSPFRYLRGLWFAYTIGKHKYVLSTFRAAVYFAFILKNSKANHIHAHFANSASEYAMLASMLCGMPFSFTVHAHDIFLGLRLIREKIELSKFVLAISSYNKRFIKERCPAVNENKIRVVHCGVDLKKLGVFSSNGNDEKRPFIILSVGRLVETKGFKYLLEACSVLLKKGISDFVCKIVGQGPLRNELEELAIGLGLEESVQFLGPLPSEKVFPLLSQADLSVLSSVVDRDGNMDGIPVYLMEAMALGKPVVSTYISGIPELVKDGAGILVPPEDSRALAEAIEEIYFMDRDGRKKMGLKGREIVEREFNLEKEVKKIRDLFLSPLELDNGHTN